jgi:pimeloyl-ACP methyl ester carboxylesterase
MFLLPFPLLLSWLFTLVSLAILGGGLYLLWAWYVGAVVGTLYLVGGVVMTLWSFAGRWIVLYGFRRGGGDEPRALPPDSVHRLERPDGTDLYVAAYGDPSSPPVVFTHGAGNTSSAWYYAQRHLADRFRVIVWDLPGLGSSRGPRNHDYSLEKHARDLEAVVGFVGGGRTVLVGHSLGGMVVQTFCRLFPERLGSDISGLALIDTSPTNPIHTTTAAGLAQAIQKPLLEPLLHVVIWLSPLLQMLNWLGYLNGTAHIGASLTGFAGTETRGQLDLATRYSPMAPPAVLARETLAMFRYDATAVLPTLPVPVLVVTGHLDRMIVPETSRRMHNSIPNAELLVLEPAGHQGIFEQHDSLIDALNTFCAPVTTARLPS